MAAAQKLTCTVERVVAHGGRVYTIVLRPDRAVPRFRAGQFLHLALDHYDPTRHWPESRVFSIASAPSRRDTLQLSYSVRGQFTARMEADLVEGRAVWVKLPYGSFVIEHPGDVVLFAGGTGITAFTAFLDELSPDAQRSVTLAYGARSTRLLIYRELVDRSVRRVPGLTASYFVDDGRIIKEGGKETDETGEPDGGGGRVGLEHATIGPVSVPAMWATIRRPFEAHYYISGPPGMLRSTTDGLRTAGVAPEAIHIDAWE